MTRNRIFSVVLLSLIAVFPTVGSAGDYAPKIGEKIPALRFKDLRHLNRSLDDFGAKKAYVLVFVNTTCPLVQRYMPRLKELDAIYSKQGVQLIAVNVGLDDTIRDMASHSLEFDALFPFVKDEDGECVKAIGAQRTPEAVVLTADKALAYRGRIDSQYRVGGPSPDAGRADLEEAIKEVLAGKPVTVAETPVDGCKITLPTPTSAQAKVTFNEHIAPIFMKHCQDCHHPGTAAPFSLTSYKDAKTHGETIAEVVSDQRMPPWFASPKFGHFKNDPTIPKEDRERVVQWVRAGMPEGDPSKLPTPKVYSDAKWRIGKPDLVVTMTQVHDVQAEGYVPYRYVVLPYVFFNETWVEAFEILPDNARVVHHCNMAYGSPGSGAGNETFITGYVPGGQPMDLGHFENDVAFRIPKNSVLGLQIHYTTTGKPEKCQISVGIRYPRRTVQRQLHHVIMDTHRLDIPPHHPAWRVADGRPLKHDVTLLGMFCHMHLRGKDMTFLAHLPSGKTETLLQIPNYNFEWQLGYELPPGTVKLPKGTKLEAVAHYDNSDFNPYNPDPKRTVPYGQQTYDEMLNGFAFFTADDEHLNLKIDPRNGRATPADAADAKKGNQGGE